MSFFKKNKIILLYALFVLLIILLVYERFLCHNLGVNWGTWPTFYANPYNHPVYLFLCRDAVLNTLNLWNEGNFVENLQVLLLFFSIILIFLTSSLIKKKNKYIYYFLIIKCIGLIYFFGEEISWGQHIFHWETHNIFLKYNIQDETNLHNISNLLNELPRTLVLIWCSFSVITVVVISKFQKVNNFIYYVICPSKNLIFISLILIFFTLPDLIIDTFNLHPGHLENPKLALFYDQISFNFLRLSELHELIFCYYFFIYSLTLKEIGMLKLYKTSK